MNQLWSDKKRILFGLPWSFTRYTLTEDKFLVASGLLNRREEEVRLYRILDVTLHRTLGERLFGLGTIHCCSADRSTPEFDIRRVRHPKRVKDLLSDQIERERDRKRVYNREDMGGNGDDPH